MEGYVVLDDCVYEFFGEGVEDFLSRLTTNVLSEGHHAFLDRFGRVVVVARLVFREGRAVLWFPRVFQERFVAHLSLYLSYSSVSLRPLPLTVVHAFSPFSFDCFVPEREGVQALVSDVSFLSSLQEMSLEDYERVCVEEGMPRQGVDFDQEMVLELAMPELVSFSKGCYPGQEIVARVSSRGRPARKLVRVLHDGSSDSFAVEGKVVGVCGRTVYSEKYGSYVSFVLLSQYERQLDFGRVLHKD